MTAKISRYFAGVGLLLAATCSAAPASAAPPETPPAQHNVVSDEAAGQTYVLGAADVIVVNVLGQPDFTTKGRIGEDGGIRVPYLGSVIAANKTTDQLADELAKLLQAGGFFAHPIVKVDIDSYGSRYVTVLGNVVTPGLVPVDRPYRLSEIVAKVGGVKESGANYVIFRPRHGEERRIPIRDLATGDLKDDPYVSPGDKIYSPEAELFYVSGQVKSPGVFPLLPNVTIRMAVSRAGGLTDAGSLKSLTVTRDGKRLGHVDPDGKVVVGDVIIVNERLF